MANNTESTPLSPLLRGIIAAGLIDEATLRVLLRDPSLGKRPVLAFLLEKKAFSSLALLQYLSERYRLPMLDLSAVHPDEQSVRRIDRALLERYQVLPLSHTRDALYLAIADPTDVKATEDIRFNAGVQRVFPILVEADKLQHALSEYLGDLTNRLEDFSSAPDSETDEDEFDLRAEQQGEDAPVVRFVQQLLLNAIQKGASDIHIEPYERDIRVRYRLDGVLQDVLHPSIALREGITSRLKILCRLDIAERRLPQDGRLRVRIPPARTIDFRVSFLPTAYGETVVLRILDPAAANAPVEQLGFLPQQLAAFHEAISKPYGMILVTGPTGSGKTTTLYTALNILNTGDVNISTAEDPVEIPVYGINQVNINERIGLTFATALRSFLRQDPDIIMVGEVRDLETAETAVKAAQTGHLVLATLHTNDAPQSLTRLENMGIPAYNIAGSVHLVIAQRLARKLCAACKRRQAIPEVALRQAGFAEADLAGWTPMAPQGCEQCNGTGYRGRIGLYQVMPVTESIQEIILRGGTSLDIARQAQAEGILTMRQAGLLRVKEGLTSLDEVLRVTNL
ncbi:type IV-A pilus assembly ATPase PilB [Candidatus Igneacidithiobacillus taiwanensis]|uniref:type IV-A pilus assembly ATPase PilB n=1 Tax=Candidatus Igneacidithiobacillus taiwanensis TaxID=1945924 RepID=UPI0028A0F54D|nr:type IV-A pilus assembly ATPase PilB [Candidatus Igneacidithiobacillus taiwanensis]MCE5359966.1 type IV-A pilus assembly ATPase PilB [Acidithiobacillus sp.]